MSNVLSQSHAHEHQTKEMLPGHVGTGTGTTRRNVGTEQTFGHGAQIYPLGTTIESERYHAKGFFHIPVK
jgi:hypothetical protein